MTYQEFKNKWNNKIVDYDGVYGGQCFDLVQQYITECLKLPATILGGCGLVNNMLKEPKLSLLLQYFDEVPVTAMNQGDIVIWDYGHIAIFDNWDGQRCWYFTQNTGTAENPKGDAHIGTGNATGLRAFRKKEDKPQPKQPKDEYYAKTPYMGVSIVDGLKAIGVDSSYDYRSKIALKNGIEGYRGTPEQNTHMLNLLKKGELKKI